MPRHDLTTSPASLPHSSLLASLVEDSIDSVRVAPMDDPCVSIYINRTGLAMLGVDSVDEFNARDPADFYGEQGVKTIVHEVAPAARHGRTWSGQATVRNVRTGARSHVLAHSFPVSDPDSGLPVAIAVIDRDITELESTRSARSRLSALVEHSRDLIAYAPMDDPMRLGYINPAGLEMLGIADVDEFNERGAEAFLGKDELRRTLDEIVPALMQGETWTQETQVRNVRTGETIPVHRQIFPINDPVTGIPVARGVIVRDVSEMKQAEDRVRSALTQKESVVAALQRLYARERRWGSQRRVIQEITTQASSILERDELLNYVVHVIQEAFDYYLVAVYLRDEDEPSLTLVAARSDNGNPPVGARVDINGPSAIARAAESSRHLINPDGGDDPLPGWRETKARIVTPIRGHDGILGVIDIHNRRNEEFDDADQAILEALASHIGVAIENATMFDQARELAALSERNRIAREIHDSLAQSLAEIRWLLESLQTDVQSGRKSAASAAETVSRLKDLTRRALREARRSVWDLGPAELETRGLANALQLAVTRVSRQAQITGRFKAEGDPSALSSEQQATILRVCQEALNNIRKHARAKNASVALQVSADAAVVEIVDDGRGFDPASLGSQRGYGLTSMRTRALAIGGEFAIDSSQGGAGTRIRLTVPLDGSKSG